MDTRIESALHSGRRATCAAGIVAAALLASCAPESDPSETFAHPRESKRDVNFEDDIATGDARQTSHASEDSTGTISIVSKEPNGGDANVSVGSAENSHEAAVREETKSFDELSAALTDYDSNARLDAVSELGDHFEDEQAATMLASAAAHDEHPSVRAEALHAIGGGRADIYIPVFAQALKDDDAAVRKAAISALEDVGGENSLQTLAIALSDPDASVRETAVDAIGEIGGSDARSLLESALGDESAAVREAANEQLAQTGSSADERGR